MTQFLPTFPAFIARRFSRTSNDDEPPSTQTPHAPSHDPSPTYSDEGTPTVSPALEEEEEDVLNRSIEQVHIVPEATPSYNRPSSIDQFPPSTESRAREIATSAISDALSARRSRARHFLRGTRQRFRYSPDDDATSSTSQPVSVGLQSSASSVSSSIQSAHDGPVGHILPEDDGMSSMRSRIIEIQNGSISNEEKARQMLAVMTERYSASQATAVLLRRPKENPPTSAISPGTETSSDSNQSDESTLRTSPLGSSLSAEPMRNPFNLTSEDRQPTYYRRTLQRNDYDAINWIIEHGSGADESDENQMPYGCLHYKRNIKLQCSTCSRWYTCRFCHDAVEDHKLVRRETKNMLCMFCNCVQKASGVCIECDQSAAWYYCDVCKLWDDNPNRSIYHCDDCGICRVGEGLGKDFHHCQTCGVCLEIKIAESHRCIERSTDCDCPICGEYMFTSPEKVVFMKCGHSIHEQCYHEHIRRSYRCPICSRSVLNMEAHFQHTKRLIEAQPMPSHLQDTKAFVSCNDCSAKTTVPYHWLGNACDVCDSFNTVILRILRIPDADTATSVDSAPETSVEPTISPSDFPNRPVSRGRGSISTRQTIRSGVSVPAVEASAMAEQITCPNGIQRSGRSASPVLLSQTSELASSSSMSVDEDEDDSDEVTFWGGSPSPSGRLGSPSSGNKYHSDHDESDDDGSSADNETSDTENDSMSDDLGSDESDEIMDLVGHV